MIIGLLTHGKLSIVWFVLSFIIYYDNGKGSVYVICLRYILKV